MGFKETPARIEYIKAAFTNLAHSFSGRKFVDPRTTDPEICQEPYRSSILDGFLWAGNDALKIDFLGGACETLGHCLLKKTRTLDVPGYGEEPTDVYVTCAHCTPGGNEAGSSSSVSASSIQLCLSAYGNYLSQSLVNGLVLRELIRLCGGKELDVWALYYYCQSTVDPAGNRWYPSLPTVVKDWMCAGSVPLTGATGPIKEIRVGTFVIWYTQNGQLYPRQSGGAVGTFGSSVTGSSNSNWGYMCP